MEIVSVRFTDDVLKNMDKAIKKNNFNSRTEFIRESVRKNLSEVNREQVMKEFLKLAGTSKVKTPIEEDRKIREEVSEEFFKELEKRFTK